MNDALSWHPVPYVSTVFGMRLLRDGPAVSDPALAITRAILRTNPQIGPIDALQLAGMTVRAARAYDLPPELLAAALLQESAYDPRALSAAGAIGIAQFEPETAQSIGVDPFDPDSAIDGAAQLFAQYIRAYQSYPVPFVEALAAYNAGPAAVSAHHGVPPYAETRLYIDRIIDRWAKIDGYEQPIEAP